MCGVKTAKRGCGSSWTTVLSTSWYVCSFILFCKLLFSWIASWIEFDDFFIDGIFRRPIIAGWGRDMGTIHRPIQISIQIYGWRQDRLVDSIKTGSTGSPTLRLTTCVRLVVSQLLEALHQFEHPVWGVHCVETTISTTLDELWWAPSNSHGDEIKDGWRYFYNFFLAVWSREQPASFSSASSSSSAAILV